MTSGPLAEPDAQRQRALRRMKLVAGGLLAVAAVVYVLCRLVGDGHGGWRFLQAAAEASMVGGLADWFAVTALFRHPLRHADPAHRDHPAQEGPDRRGPGRVRPANFLTAEIVGERVPPRRSRAASASGWPTRARAAGRGRAEQRGRRMANRAARRRLRQAIETFADERLRELPSRRWWPG